MTIETANALHELGRCAMAFLGFTGAFETTITRRGFVFWTPIEEGMNEKTEICKYCDGEFDPVEWNGELSFPLHKDPDDTRYGCDGAGKPLAVAAKNYVAPEKPARHNPTDPIRLDPDLGNSKMKSFYGD